MQGTNALIRVVQELSFARDRQTVQEIVRHAARALTGADGATFVLRDGERCFYVDEDAIGPLWKGQRFPLTSCISGWSMLNKQAVAIPDIYVDDRIPHDAYRPTFVHSLVMVPIRRDEPLGAIGTYWANNHEATDDELALLQALADSTAVAIEHVQVLHELEDRVAERTEALEREIREREKAEAAVRRLSATDELTGIANRRGFLTRAEQVLGVYQRHEWPISIVFLDLDGLKEVNDAGGHDAGDAMLRRAAAILASMVRGSDVVGRWGGDEFVALLSDTDDPQAFIDRVRVASGEQIRWSAGAVTLPGADQAALEAAVRQADERMYADKRARRG